MDLEIQKPESVKIDVSSHYVGAEEQFFCATVTVKVDGTELVVKLFLDDPKDIQKLYCDLQDAVTDLQINGALPLPVASIAKDSREQLPARRDELAKLAAPERQRATLLDPKEVQA